MIDKHFTPHTTQKELLEKWESLKAFDYDSKKPESFYTIIMPPPNVTGSLHMGHALTFTLQDILIRSKRKLGKNVLWQPGTDHAGIATQIVVERQLSQSGLSRFSMGREAFVQRIWEWKDFSGGTINNQLRKLGASAPWHRDCFTMDPAVNEAVYQVFNRLYKDNLLYKSKRLVNWNIHQQTAISDIEVTHKTSQDPFYFIRYPVVGDPTKHITIATTRPETMFADVAVAVHPEDERYQDLIGQHVTLPLTDRTIPIIADEWCKSDVGTGAVKITPGHDFNDYDMGLRHNLPMLEVIDDAGKMIFPAHPDIVGMDRLKAREKISSILEEQGFLDHIETITHSVPYAERSDCVIEPRLMDQWYVDAPRLAHKAIEAVVSGQTKFVPEYWSHTYFEWMRNIQPWCVSRQIWWGHRIPAWYGPDGKVFVAQNEDEAQANAAKHYGKQTPLVQDPDVLDTWFSSALWPFVTLGWPNKTPELAKHYPGDVLVTGHDIIFFWVARMMMMGIYIMGDVPFKEVYIHALVKDEKGQKMSKSKGNIVDPLDLIETYGADALRLTLALQAAPGRDIKFSSSRIEGAKHFITKLWNAARYSLMNHCHYDPTFDPQSVEHKINQWVVGKVEKLKRSTIESLDSYAFHELTHDIYHAVWGTFCDWYLEFTKPLLLDDNSPYKLETQKTTAWALVQFLHILNPIIPFVTEELWAHIHDISGLPNPALLSLSPFQTNSEKSSGEIPSIQWVIGFIEEIRSACTILGIPAGTSLRVTYYSNDSAEAEWINEFASIIQKMVRLNSLDFVNTPNAPFEMGSVVNPYGLGSIFIPLQEVLDIEKESARLKKEIGKLTGEKEQMSKKLNNQEFLNKAPEEVVDELKVRFSTATQTIQKLEQTVARFISSSK
ncbi:MAG: valine--tRNA ligase [Alphaproteobacteria bacterium]|nr:valine--tRNA ligase [Alphaproteobacteria bacterium]OJV47162.1 MAG: valine--tRNA ligase [Alphaproteobacteria bacterium 43-37]